jgi:hypothetical protein
MKNILFLLLLFWGVKNSQAFAIWDVELTPKNYINCGFSFKVISENRSDDLLNVTVTFNKLRPKIEAHPGATIVFRDKQDTVIATCPIQSINEQTAKNRDILPSYLKSLNKSINHPLSFSFSISKVLLENSTFCIYEEAMFNNNEKYWFRLKSFVNAQQGAAANP